MQATDQEETASFAQWIIDIGDGIIGHDNDGYATIEIPQELLITKYDDPIHSIVSSTFPDLCHHHNDPQYFQSKAILASTNETVQQVNDYILTLIPVKTSSNQPIYDSSASNNHYSIMSYTLGKAMTLPPPTTSHHQNTLPFSATSTSALQKSLSQRHCHYEFGFINCLKQGFPAWLDILDDTIEIPVFYHQQWEPDYPEFVHFKYDGATYEIRVRQHRGKFFFADGLTRFRKELEIYELITIDFLAYDHHSKFDLDFTPPVEQQACKRPCRASRKHIWTVPITQSKLATFTLYHTMSNPLWSAYDSPQKIQTSTTMESSCLTVGLVINMWFNLGVEPESGRMMQSYPTRALDRKLQIDWARDAREGPRILMSLRTHLLLEVASPLSLPFSIPLSFIFREAKESIDEEDPRPTSSNEACIMWYQSIFI
ncbi:hypothetical protein D0Y65_041944 [Glycine soja]|uniref:DUF7271 domain-containing protein n=1 Tax=Glycine soja TaxID=3848 RepID=A0A445GXW6_GLYSO|nr:hypothetical protein D0Y65_041944 [Glycine soja]